MSDAHGAASDANASDTASQDASSAGEMLRGAREKAGLHIGALAVSLKVPVNKLEALEADRLDLLPDAVFGRALASAVCRALKLDPGPVLLKMPDQVVPRLQLDAKVGKASFDTPGMGWRLPLLSRLSKPAAITVAVLLLAALVVLLLPSLEFVKVPLPSAPLAAGGAPLPAPVRAVPAIPSAPPVSPAAVPVVAVPYMPPAQSVAPVQAASPSAVPAVAGQKADAQVSDPSLVVFRTRGPSWVEVTDAAGVVQLRKMLAGGETAGASGTPPLAIVVGRVDSTEMLVRGKPFDLAPLSKDNVARFQIK